ncbi:MAG: hypothetical protein KGY51_06060 [Psychroflexus sp.]|nr:hypothetical protein [Psychroflexus sp.]
MPKIILENRFNIYQKIIILFVIGFSFLYAISNLLEFDLNFKGYILVIVFVLCYGFLMAFAFTKRGFTKINSKLYRASFVMGLILFKKHIYISEFPKIAILKFKKSQKLPWFYVSKPDLASDFNSFEVNLLNARHTKRNAILDLKKQKNLKPTIEFLTSNFKLKHETYSPSFRSNPRRRR